MLFSLYEIGTGFHFHMSNSLSAPVWSQHIPTVLYHNSNDFAAIFTFIVASSITVPSDLSPSATTIALPPPVASTLAGEHP